MKQIGTAMQELGYQNPNKLERQHSGAITAQREETGKCVAVALTQAFDTMKTYGADPESLDSRVTVFTRVLQDYSAHSVQSAFDHYFENSTGLPEPSDIVKIIKERQVYNRPEYKVFPKEENHPCYIDLSDPDKAKTDEALAKARAVLEADKPDKKKEKPLVDHFTRMPIEAQEQVRADWIESVKKRNPEQTLSDWE